ncbi:serine/threonine-protein kinase HipA [Rhodovulum bhavnagarense]|uniref:Serine/threonine-protein kinase HipA n=1 Tax=Rhodovulum bhavnagarense TaxID=992286 RepID=A0A4R2RFZ4_9RHOB|nr:HipA domain-containing protein [Rhodovulum bhavnagarense]TCP61448.1 serine/threonine-protein kinase HipA [Rhodovulum bhavnagarense]
MTVLDVYLEAVAQPIGQLSSDPEGEMSFAYHSENSLHAISASLPVRKEPYGDVAARGFFSNLLFENEMRDQAMQRHGLSERDIVGLLYHLGADCPGAISCVPEGARPGKRPGVLKKDYAPLDGSPVVPADLHTAAGPLAVAGELVRLMTSLRDNRRLPPDTDDPSPLAGVQGKIALTRLADGRLALPVSGSGAPTTHILKVPRAGQMGAVQREHQATRVMAAIQSHPVAQTCILGEGDLQGLLVARFDRRVDGGKVYRIHQEDFCQALGLGDLLKYERNGVPPRIFTAEAVGRLLDQTRVPGQARIAFFEITLANMLLGNSDNHAKNHALLYTGTRPELAPAYDIDPVLLDDVNHEMAFRVGTARMADDVTEADFDLFLKAIGARGFGRPLAKRVAEIVTAALAATADLARPSRKRLTDVICQQAHHLSENVGLDIAVPEFDAVPVNRP